LSATKRSQPSSRQSGFLAQAHQELKEKLAQVAEGGIHDEPTGEYRLDSTPSPTS